MVTYPFGLYAWGVAQALVWLNDMEDALLGAKLRPPGIIVGDSTAFVRGAEHWTVYMQDVLQAVYERTGHKCILVACGGLAFYNTLVPSKTYQHVLHDIMLRCEAPRFMVWISMGNDIYPPRADMRAYERGLLVAVGSLLTQAYPYCRQHCILYGGSSEVWQYAKHFEAEACREYDRVCGAVCRYFQEYAAQSAAMRGRYLRLDARTGADLLQGVELVDRIGHMSAGSMAILRDFYTELVRWGMSGEAPVRSRL